MDKLLTRLICAAVIIFMTSCASRVDVVEHYIPSGYEGWILILLDGKPDQINSNEPKLVYHYNELGVAIKPNRVTYNWRKDQFYYVGDGLSQIPVEGEIETSGSRYYREMNNTYYFISGWVGEKPLGGRVDHLMTAIMKAESETFTGPEASRGSGNETGSGTEKGDIPRTKIGD